MSTDVLVLGAGGRVGAALCRLLPDHGLSVAGVARSAGEPDMLAADRLTELLAAHRPRAVVYAAAIADPDACERDPERSYEVNVAGVTRLAAAAARLGVTIIYYSSDYVFGSPGTYSEDAEVSPLQVYGRHKVEAEQVVLDAGDNAVLRLPLLFGARDFVAAAVHAARDSSPLAVDDRRRYPIPLTHVVAATASVIAAATPGIYHAVGVDAVTKREWAAYIAGLLDADVPAPAPAAASTGAPRPVDVELATARPQLRTRPGTLWAATRDRVAELLPPR